jgi:hypothetical protein
MIVLLEKQVHLQNDEGSSEDSELAVSPEPSK